MPHRQGAGVSRRALLSAAAVLPAAVAGRARGQGTAPLKIGVLCDFSGVYADDTGPGLLLAAQFASQDFGARLLDRPVEIVFADDQNKPDVGTGIARRWLDEEGVQAILCGSASSITLAVADLVRDRNRILLISGSLSADLTGKACKPTSFQFGFDTYSATKAVVQPAVAQGLKTWFVINVDYTFGHSLRQETAGFVAKAGGRMLGSVAFPLNTADLSSFLVQAQASGAQAIGLACGGSDWTNLVKQSHEFGMNRKGQTLVALSAGFNEVMAAGLEAAEGMMLSTPWYWDMNDASRAFAKRFIARHKGVAPNWQQACGYSALNHYLHAVRQAASTDGAAVAGAMRAAKVHDFTVENATIRADGQVMRPTYLAQVKAPAQSRDSNDLFRILSTLSPEESWRPAGESACPLLRPT
ncbi:ABC transporter substrate-binding protein [Rhodopila sp.]|jgi:branched-chain amino acid transport system substrate-binding protein|uniref:ABC transporter substrate-binding protein n=1 Tax=Rhodopila sp. TaxID=2480087 RepID=UPI002B5100AA|nr:ABC transporter substrate-binding protein [Rhodopila sp.]HVZ07064.1 ABC transporter substrate-binding protein [Rhodopila sp.]